jgi:beta-fructofuranosidase
VPLQASPDHDMLWINGNVTKSANGTVHFEPTMAGVLDWGIQSYAAAGKLLPASSQASKNSGTTVDRFLSYLWLTNDDYGQSEFPVQQQGWDGTLLTARELSKGTIENVVDNSLVHEKASWQVTARNDSAGTVELATLRQKIVREAYSAFTKNASNVHHQLSTKLKSSKDLDVSPDSKFFVLNASIDFSNSARNDSSLKAGFKILSSKHESTSIYYRTFSYNLQADLNKPLTKVSNRILQRIHHNRPLQLQRRRAPNPRHHQAWRSRQAPPVRYPRTCLRRVQDRDSRPHCCC